jgi:hydroxyacylglutathione hydrolase
MILKQYYLGCLAHASYLVGDAKSRTAAIVDPQRDIDRYLEDARRLDLEIRHVFLSHFHADFLAGHLELRDQVGARIYLGSRAQAEYEFTPMSDGDNLEFGQVRLQIMETPGHSPESISILVYDLEIDENKPHAVLTGDTLFIGDVGRPDLRAALGWSADELGALLYESVQKKLLPLPDETLVYPAHGAGSLCGKNMSEDTVSTIGVQRQYNYALQPMSKDEFIRIVTADQPDTPDYFTYDAILNTKEHPTLATSLTHGLNGLSVSEVCECKSAGAVLLDTREPSEFAGAHWKGSLNVGLQGKYATWTGTLLDAEDPIVLIAEPGREEESAMRLGRIGFDGVEGYLDGGMMALESKPELIGKVDRITAGALNERIPSTALQVIDVRAPSEWQGSHIPSSVNLPLSQLGNRLEEIPQGEVVVHCASGYRSSVATSLIIRERPESKVSDFVGGLEAWLAAGLPTVSEG